MNFDEFMKDKCGGGIKENIMCMKVWEKVVEKNRSCKLCLMCQGRKRRKKIEKKTIERKKILKEKKGEKKEKFKSKECA